MACNLSDPDLQRARTDILGDVSNWLIITYRPNSKDELVFLSQGIDGLEGLKVKLAQNEAQFAFLKMEKKHLLITFTPDIIGGVKRARAMVHSRAVGSFFQVPHSSLNVNTIDELTLSAVRNKLNLNTPAPLPPPPVHPSQQHDLPPRPPPRSLPRVPPASLDPVDSKQEEEIAGTIPSASTTAANTDESPLLPSPPPPPPPPRKSTEDDQQHNHTETHHNREHEEEQLVGSSSKSNEESSIGDSAAKSSASPSSRNNSPLPDTTSRTSTSSQPQHHRHNSQNQSQHYSHEQDNSKAGAGQNSSNSSTTSSPSRPRPPRMSSFEQVKTDDRNTPSPVVFPSSNSIKSMSDNGAIGSGGSINGGGGARKSSSLDNTEMILSASERKQEEKDAQQRKEAADRLEREVQRQRENEAKRIAAEEAEQKRLLEQEKQRYELEQKQLKLQQQIKFKADLRKRFENENDLNTIMIKGYVTVQGGNSMFWRRRWFELYKNRIVLYKSDSDTTKYIDQIMLSPNYVKAIILDPEEASVAHAFKIDFTDSEQDSYLLYCDEHDDKEVLVAGLKCGAGLDE